MSDEEPIVEVYELGDKCVVPWKDGSCYTGRVQKILDPAREVIIQGVPTRKGGKPAYLEDTTPLSKVRKDRTQRVSYDVINQSLESQERWYYVHYFGWKADYDEWLPIERMLPFTPKNINMMKSINAEIKERERIAKEKLLAEQKKSKTKSKRKREDEEEEGAEPDPEPKRSGKGKRQRVTKSPEPALLRGSTPELTGKGRKRRVVIDDDAGLEIKLQVPLDFKRLLVSDWELVTKSREVVQLPRSTCVREILQDFVNAQTMLDPDNAGRAKNLEQYRESMITYFDYALGMMLLYRFERNQYYGQSHKDPKFKPSLVYGAEHLARLVVSIPAHLSQMATMDDITMKYIVEQTSELAKFMTEHHVRYFSGDEGYDAVTRVYQATSVPNTDESIYTSRPESEAEGAEVKSE